MKEKFIQEITNTMADFLDIEQLATLNGVLLQVVSNYTISSDDEERQDSSASNLRLLEMFLSAKQVEGCSVKTAQYYEVTIKQLFKKMPKKVVNFTTDDIRAYLAVYQRKHKSSKVTIDNIRRIFSSFFSWLEEEDYIIKSPVRRIHKVKTGAQVKETLSDENLETLRDSCTHIRDLAIIDMLSSTGIRVGELVKLNREDVNFSERECIVFGKGNKERIVYFNARTKIHLQQYLALRKDRNKALFVSLAKPHTRLGISGVEYRLRKIGRNCKISRVHPHKFRRTLATMAIDKGMPVEQVQKLLGHVKIDTTMHYAMVNQTNVKLSHRKFLG
jgi:site-specific recombinase XerD